MCDSNCRTLFLKRAHRAASVFSVKVHRATSNVWSWLTAIKRPFFHHQLCSKINEILHRRHRAADSVNPRPRASNQWREEPFYWLRLRLAAAGAVQSADSSAAAALIIIHSAL